MAVRAAGVGRLEREPGGGLSPDIDGKGGMPASVALNERATRAIQAVAAGRGRGVLFEPYDRGRSRHGHEAPPIPYTQQAVSRLLVELANAAGLLGADHGEVDRMHPHRLRHTFVTILLDRGQGLATVQDTARHASADTTRLYDKKRDAYRTHPTTSSCSEPPPPPPPSADEAAVTACIDSCNSGRSATRNGVDGRGRITLVISASSGF